MKKSLYRSHLFKSKRNVDCRSPAKWEMASECALKTRSCFGPAVLTGYFMRKKGLKALFISDDLSKEIPYAYQDDFTFQQCDIQHSIKSSSKIKNLEEKNLVFFLNVCFGKDLSHIFLSIDSTSVKWVLLLWSNLTLTRQHIDLDLHCLATFLSKFFFKLTW